MNDLEISKALALVIGWELDQMSEHQGFIYVADWPNKKNRATVLNSTCYPIPFLPWRKFDYRDTTVIWPIAERYSLFPSGVSNGNYAAAEKLGRPINDSWECLRWHYDKIDGKARGWVRYTADTAAKAVALAVIGRKA